MLTLIKLGGSLLTDKTKTHHFRQNVTSRIASEVKLAIRADSNKEIIIGHGSGSFGHVEAQKYNTINGVYTAEEWLGFTKVGQVASELSQLVTQEFVKQNVPLFRFQPSSSLVANNKTIVSMEVDRIKQAIANGLIPMLHGDVAFDNTIGGTIISTETLFIYLLSRFEVSRIILLGEVDGVLDENGIVIPQITPETIDEIKDSLQGSRGVDVTGGMYQKVMDMVHLVEKYPQLEVTIANGNIAGVLPNLLSTNIHLGTRIKSIE